MNNEIGNWIDSIRREVKNLYGIKGPKAEATYKMVMHKLEWFKDEHGYAWRQYDAHVRTYREMMK